MTHNDGHVNSCGDRSLTDTDFLPTRHCGNPDDNSKLNFTDSQSRKEIATAVRRCSVDSTTSSLWSVARNYLCNNHGFLLGSSFDQYSVGYILVFEVVKIDREDFDRHMPNAYVRLHFLRKVKTMPSVHSKSNYLSSSAHHHEDFGNNCLCRGDKSEVEGRGKAGEKSYVIGGSTQHAARSFFQLLHTHSIVT